jgi:dethiobiotin synthetase
VNSADRGSRNAQRGYFITGTDTGIGKTLVACALLRAYAATRIRVVGMKPVAAGTDDGRLDDVERLIAASNVAAPREWVNPYAFHLPVAPHIAAAGVGRRIEIPVIRAAFEQLSGIADRVVVEGIGGFLVPINQAEDMGDVARALGLPVILVVGMRLGCLNHALLTARSVISAGLRFAGWIANHVDPGMLEAEANIRALEERLACPLLARVPYLETADPGAVAPRIPHGLLA